MIGLVCQYTPCQHLIIHPEIEGFIKRQVSDSRVRDRLFMYYHLREHTFVIAEWVMRRVGFVDVMNLGHSLCRFTKREADIFRVQFGSPVTGRDVSRMIVQHERDRLLKKQDGCDEDREHREWRKKQIKQAS